MKKVFFGYLLLSSLCIVGQDTLFFKTGEKQVAKISEINTTEIKYQKFDNLTGPSYTKNKNEVSIIKYFGGQVDSFNIEETPKVVVEVPKPKPKPKMIYYGTKVMYDSYTIGNSEFLSLINAHPNESERKKMQGLYRKMIGHRDIATASLSCGLIFGCVIVVATAPFVTGLNDSFLFPTEEGLQVALAGILSGAAMRITGFAVSQAQRNKRKARTREITSIYNGDYDFKK